MNIAPLSVVDGVSGDNGNSDSDGMEEEAVVPPLSLEPVDISELRWRKGFGLE